MSKPLNIFAAGWCAAFALIQLDQGNAGWVAILLVVVGLNLYAGMRR